MITYNFLQNYWWFIISLLGGLLVFLLFVQGGNSLYPILGRDEASRRMLINSTGRKWEFTFTTLVTFGGAFFASFPLFYSTSFGGAYWLWMLILLSFVLQAVSYEFQSKVGNVLGRRGYRILLIANGFMGPFLLGVAVATFFTGADFTVNKLRLGDVTNPVVSTWGSAWHGLEALANLWNVVLGLAVYHLARVLALQYFINNVRDDEVEARSRHLLKFDTVLFLAFFLAFAGRLFTMTGQAVEHWGHVTEEPLKYLNNLLQQPFVLVLFLAGVVLVLFGTLRSIFSKTFRRGIWFGRMAQHVLLSLDGRPAQLALPLQQLRQRPHPAGDERRLAAHTLRAGLHFLLLACHRPQAHHTRGAGERRASVLIPHTTHEKIIPACPTPADPCMGVLLRRRIGNFP